MTGFAQVTGENCRFSWVWEAKSVNARGFDVRIRLPQGLEVHEVEIRNGISKLFKRGSITLTLKIDRMKEGSSLRINEDLLQQILDLQQKLKGKVSGDPVRLDTLLSLRGLMEFVEGESDEISETWDEEVEGTLEEVLSALREDRLREGERLSEFVTELLNRLELQCHEAEHLTLMQPKAMKAKFTARLDEFLDHKYSVTEERLAQEIALLISKSDLREEFDRLSAHVEAIRGLLAFDGPIGRKLDFLFQEINREANTVCSKSPDINITQIGLELKTFSDQMREQAQNIE